MSSTDPTHPASAWPRIPVAEWQSEAVLCQEVSVGEERLGGHVGGAFAGDSSFQSSDARFMGGVQGGFDYQFAPNWVLGVEAQYSWLPTNNNGARRRGAARGLPRVP